MKIFLTGASGFLGSNLLRVAQEKFNDEIFAAVHSWQPQSSPNFQFAPIELTDRDAVLTTVRAVQPDVIIHSAFMIHLAQMYRERELAWRTNVEATHHLTDAANECGAQIIFISTDWVFDGMQGDATEVTPPNPINYYGVMKVASERIIAERANNWAVARVAGMSGVHWLRPNEELVQNAGFGNFVSAILTSLQRGEPFRVWLGENVNLRATPSLATDSAEMILKIAHLDAQGIFHCTGGESIRRLQFAQRIARTFGYDENQIQPAAPTVDLPRGARIPEDSSLNAQYTARTLNHSLLDVEEILARFRHEEETGVI